jgi:NifU-like protein
MPIYPDRVNAIAMSSRYAGRLGDPSATGRGVNFECGSGVTFEIVERDGTIVDIKFTTNGCGFMVAASECLADRTKGRELREIGLQDDGRLDEELGAQGRKECIDAAGTALRAAFAELRAARVREFRGESALICSCFGVDELSIEESIRHNGLRTVEEVSDTTRAGGGCGSCRMVIQEMLDAEAGRGDML